MDSLYSGLKALECRSKNKEERVRVEMESSAVPMVRVDKDMFVLADDVIALLERVASEPLPVISLPPKDDKIFQNRTMEGSSTDGFIERDERRLTELGRRTIEIFVLSHIFSRIEVAYQESISLKRQEELIREEEEAGQAEHELKIKRAIAEKDKRTKKKQGKQKRNNRRNKEKQRDLKPDSTLHSQKHVEMSSGGELSLKHGNVMMPEDASDASCDGDDVDEVFRPSVEAGPSEMSTYTPEKMNLGLDDSSSTCSTDSVPLVISNGTRKEYSVMINNNIETLPNSSKNSGNKQSHAAEITDSCPSLLHEFEGGDAASQKPLMESHERTLLVEKQEPTATLPPPRKPYKDRPDAERPPNTQQQQQQSSSSPTRKTPPVLPHSKQSRQNHTSIPPPPPPPPPPPSSSSSTSRSQHQKLHTISNPNPPPIPNPPYFPLSYRNAIVGQSVNPDPPPTELYNSDHGVSPPYMADEFPHLDIINDLLNEEQSSSNQYHHRRRSFSGRFSFPVDAAAVDSSRALERIRGGPYGNRNWVYNPADLSFVNLGGADRGRMYSFQNVSDYSNFGRGMNQYGLYRP